MLNLHSIQTEKQLRTKETFIRLTESMQDLNRTFQRFNTNNISLNAQTTWNSPPWTYVEPRNINEQV